ncbi:class I SAM-dependent methyltransferase [Streptomyces lichenis]|uniref:Class I SAM-dependent methyltransferase n=1 Tax=Streptomyces lichenis TaxID=2306967 RepID=A0ABT0I529_9ACTN|nr:class I SAM-dependent methyltransferase [Streptomyces lichenis]MCK8676444.1 class I SAM-dependent methyltransferase [Streptomyces lichenis]
MKAHSLPTWQAYADQTPGFADNASTAPPRMEWGTSPGVGPGAEMLGPAIRDREILELGCGPGHHAAHLASQHGGRVMAVDMVKTQIRRANERYGKVDGVTFVAHEAAAYLRSQRRRFSVIYSVFGAVGLVDPDCLLPLIARRLRSQGRLVFSVPHPQRTGGTATLGRTSARQDWLTLPDGTRHPLWRWELGVADWSAALSRHGLRLVRHQSLQDPGRPPTLLVMARRN